MINGMGVWDLTLGCFTGHLTIVSTDTFSIQIPFPAFGKKSLAAFASTGPDS